MVKYDIRRETWVDNVKIIACILVVLGHFFKSMVAENILSDSNLHQWFIKTIYYFHVPLFFVCSGYLYQKFSTVNNYESWINNILKKLLSLGVPYFTFSFITWLIKTLFSGDVNIQADGLFKSLFFVPISPYWYLYVLFFVFFITPNFKNYKWAYAAFVVALICKIFICFVPVDIYIVSKLMSNLIWFVIGMCLGMIHLEKNKVLTYASIIGSTLFILSSVLVFLYDISHGIISFILGLLACFSVIVLAINISYDKHPSKLMKFLSRYTMPIFLMHTLFAAAVRILLLKLGVDSPVFQVPIGLFMGFIGPIVIAIIMKKMKWPEFFIYPGKFIKIK